MFKYLFIILFFFTFSLRGQSMCDVNSILYIAEPFYLIIDTVKRRAHLDYCETYHKKYIATCDTLFREVVVNDRISYVGHEFKILLSNDSIELLKIVQPSKYWYHQKSPFHKKYYYRKYFRKTTFAELKYYTSLKNYSSKVTDSLEQQLFQILVSDTNDNSKPNPLTLTEVQKWIIEHSFLCHEEYYKQAIEFKNELIKNLKTTQMSNQ